MVDGLVYGLLWTTVGRLWKLDVCLTTVGNGHCCEHLHYMCTPFARWARRVASYCDGHTQQISSLSNLALYNLRIAFRRFETWAAMLHYDLHTRGSWMASMHEASQMY